MSPLKVGQALLYVQWTTRDQDGGDERVHIKPLHSEWRLAPLSRQLEVVGKISSGIMPAYAVRVKRIHKEWAHGLA